MKHTSHLYRMNPQSAYRARRLPKLSSLLAGILLLSLVALYWIGKHTG